MTNSEAWAPLLEYLVQQGYIVVQADVRGSVGYGREFREAFLMDYGGKDLDDLETVVDGMKSLPYVDGHRIGIWGKTAESLHEYLTKGKQIYVEGRIQTRDWTDKEGKQQRTTEIRADRIVLLGGGGGGGEGRASRPREQRYSESEQQPVEAGAVDAPHDDDIPF